jgi:uncharacterized protein involved in exopolysaccharide biosynthesis
MTEVGQRTAREREAGGAFVPAFASEPERIDRVGILWDGKWWILAAATLAAAAAAGIASRLPPTYSASTLVRVVAQANGGSGQDVVLASNNFASQYAELVDSSPVIAAAARKLGVPPNEIRNGLSAGTVSGQNLVRVSAEAEKPEIATRRADAVAAVFVERMRSANRRQSLEYTRSVERQLVSSNREIDRARDDVEQATLEAQNAYVSQATAAAANLAAKQSALTTLLTQRQTILASLAQTAASQPTVTIWSAADRGGKVQPPLFVFAIAAFAVMAFAAAQVLLLVRGRRAR